MQRDANRCLVLGLKRLLRAATLYLSDAAQSGIQLHHIELESALLRYPQSLVALPLAEGQKMSAFPLLDHTADAYAARMKDDLTGVYGYPVTSRVWPWMRSVMLERLLVAICRVVLGPEPAGKAFNFLEHGF